MLVVLLVLLSAAICAFGLVLLRKATEKEPPAPSFSLRLLWALIRRRPLWSAGIGAIIAGFSLQVLALAHAPVSEVQLIFVLELPFALILSRMLLGGRLRRLEWTAIGAMTLGVPVLWLSLSPDGGDPHAAGLGGWLAGLLVTGAAIAAAVLAGQWAQPAARTALAGMAAGMTTGLTAVLVRAVAVTIPSGLTAVLTSWHTWALGLVGVAGFFLLQNALQSGRLVASQPGITLANPLVAGIWGVWVFDEEVRTGAWLLGGAAGAALLVAGAMLLSRSPLLAGHREAPEPDFARR